MNDRAKVDVPPGTTRSRPPRRFFAPAPKFILPLLVLAGCYAGPLSDLARFAWEDDLFSHTLLVPFISMALMWLRSDLLPAGPKRPAPIALLPILLGVGLVLGYGFARASGFAFHEVDYLAITIGSFVCLVLGWSLVALGAPTVRVLAFPFGFLFLMAPFPAAATQLIELFFQHASAGAAHFLFQISGNSLVRDGMIFHFPGLSIEVAQDCSGILSSLVLFLTSLVAGHLLLTSRWQRTLLAVAVIPLAILRNAFRIWSIVLLTLHVNPKAIHSPLHNQGGTLFFLLSLIPFFLLLAWLRRRQRPRLPGVERPQEPDVGR